MPRSYTSGESQIQRGEVTFAFSRTERQHVTVITLPPQSTWSASPHWHETHTEYLRVVSGTALVRVGSAKRKLSMEDGPLEIPRGTIHDWRREPESDGVLVVEEWTEPADGEKELFFRNLFSSIRDMTSNPPMVTASGPIMPLIPFGWQIELQVLVISAYFDNYPLFFEGAIGAALSRPFLLILSWIGRLVGYRATYPEYTPEELSKKHR